MPQNGILALPFVRELQALIVQSDSDSEAEEKAITSLKQLSILLTKCKDKLSAQHITTLFINLSSLSSEDQKLADNIISYVMSRCEEHLNQQSKRRQFSIHRISAIFRSLTKLPVSIQKNSGLYLLLLTRLNETPDHHFNSPQVNTSILLAFAKLDLSLQDYSELLENLLQPFDMMAFDANEVETEVTSKLWQFCGFMLAKAKEHTSIQYLCETLKISDTNQRVNEFLQNNTGHFVTTVSHFQKELSEPIEELLQNAYQQDIKLEYVVGVYPLDISIPSAKLNIEIDGPTHYRRENLIRNSRFRDYLLFAYEGWRIIRIRYFSWKNQNDKQAKTDYLLQMLESYPEILHK